MTQSTTAREYIDIARKKWIAQLIDDSRNNNLLYFRDSRTSTLDFSRADRKHIESLLMGDKVPIAAFCPDQAASDIRERTSGVFKRALLNLEEKGLRTLHVALGMATWPAEDKGRPARAAVALLPVTLDPKGPPPNLQRAGPPQINLALLHTLESEFGCILTSEALLDGLFQDSDIDQMASADDENAPGPLPDLYTLFDRLREGAKHVAGFAIEEATILSNFSFQKMAMVRDIQDYADQIASHPILTAMAGDMQTRLKLIGERQDVTLGELDSTPADQEFLVLDADSSQQRVIASVARLQDGVIQGPPGTGKSQTIVNMIATLVANGKRVLFVAEKQAALKVVYDRLKRIGLDHLVLDLHGADVSSKQVYDRIVTALPAIRDANPIDATQPHEQFHTRRDKLNRHVVALHKKRQPLGLSAFELQGKLIRLPSGVESTVRFRGGDLDRLTPDVVHHVRDLLAEGAGFAGLLLGTDPSPWTKATINSGDDLNKAVDMVNALHAQHLPQLRRLLDQICALTGLKRPQTVKEADALSALLDDASEAFARYKPAIFEHPIEEYANELTPATNGATRLITKITRPGYRRAVSTLRDMRLTSVDEAQLRKDVLRLRGIATSWKQMGSTSLPSPVAEQQALHDCVIQLAQMNDIQRYLPGFKVGSVPLEELEAIVAKFADDHVAPRQLLRVRQIQRELDEYRLEPFLLMLENTAKPPEVWCDAFDFALWHSHLDRAFMDAPELGAFRGETHQKVVDEFKQLDQRRTELAVQRVRRVHAEIAINVRNDYPEENALIKDQIQRKRRRLPLRDLLAKAPNVLTAIFPCWMASPLSISQLLKADQRYFDIVIFDEASQVPPEDAVPAIMRAEHVVVAGDRNQLPPTTFFAGGIEDEETGDDNDMSGVGAFESVLDLMSGISEGWTLDWHYRSRDESLIAFSNHHIYQDQMVTFPGTASDAAISHVLVDSVPRDGEIDSVSAEVQQVVELVLEHARTRPNETLGVITMGIKHADRITHALESELGQHPELDHFFDTNRPERFFVKNLERVQGDERDVIIISIGYGKDANGRLPYRFGPLNMQGGERRLNVAVTRARYRLTLVSSFGHHDMDPSRSTSRGVTLLRMYLEYAASNGRTLGRLENGMGMPANPFETDVFNALSARGLQLEPQWGVSRYRLDFAVKHPNQPGRFVLAIECDGATYHSAPTARDRDRLRQQVLTSLGWRFHRIWSTDWFNNRDTEIDRAVAAYHAACADDARPKTPTAPPAPKVKPAPVAMFAKTVDIAPSATLHLDRPKKIVTGGRSIDTYTTEELVELVCWVKSDGKLRDNEELFEDVYRELGFGRRGARITQRIRAAIEASKSQ